MSLAAMQTLNRASALLFAGSANPALAKGIEHHLGASLGRLLIERFPDQESHVELLDDPRDREVFLLQPTSPPPDQHLFELLSLADACRRAGARRITAVVPYFGYARQDRRARGREAVAARLVADLMVSSGINRLVTLDLHTPAIEGFFTIPVEALSAVSLLVEAVRSFMPGNGVVVAPDFGAARLADKYASLLGLPVAIVHKTRTGPREVTSGRVSGDVRGKVPIIVDDMISTGGTIAAALAAVVSAGAVSEPAIVVATHGLFVADCVSRLQALKLKRIVVTDSIPSPSPSLPADIVSVATLLADTIKSLTALH